MKRGRLPGDRVPPELAAEFRAKIREAMTIYGLSAADIVVNNYGEQTGRSAQWVHLQLAPSRRLMAENARELYRLVTACKKVQEFLDTDDRGLDWELDMMKLWASRFSSLLAPDSAEPIAVLVSPDEAQRLAAVLSEEVARVPGIGARNKPAIQRRIYRWLNEHGGASGQAFVRKARSFTFRYNKEPLDARQLSEGIGQLASEMWIENTAYREWLLSDEPHRLSEDMAMKEAAKKIAALRLDDRSASKQLEDR